MPIVPILRLLKRPITTLPFRVAGLALLLLLAPVGFDATVCGQSLGDLARQEAERRKTLTEEGKVFTNKDVPRVPSAGGASSGTAAASQAPSAKPPEKTDAADTSAAKEPAAGADAEPVKPAKAAKDEAYWSGRKRALLDQLDRDQTYADALQSRINALTTDFVNRDDPAQRTVIANDRQKAVVELDRLKKAIVEDKKAIADFEDEAHRAGVPPGWLR